MSTYAETIEDWRLVNVGKKQEARNMRQEACNSYMRSGFRSEGS